MFISPEKKQNTTGFLRDKPERLMFSRKIISLVTPVYKLPSINAMPTFNHLPVRTEVWPRLLDAVFCQYIASYY